jgi:phosphotransferase system enzyme I (PtsI)
MIYTGTMIAPGIAWGPAVLWAPADEPPGRRTVPAEAVPAEQQRFEQALRRVGRELEEIASRVAVTTGKSSAAIFTAFARLLGDPALHQAVTRRITEEHLEAESAVWAALDEYVQRLAALNNAYLASRADDLQDLGRRLLTHLRKQGPRQVPTLPQPVILVAESLAAADVVALPRQNLLAIVLIQSGPSSHAALLAATFGVPVVGGVPELAGHVVPGETVVVDGNHGHVVLNPTPLALREYQTRQAIFKHFCGEMDCLRDLRPVTPDGRVVSLQANVGLAQEVPHALALGAEGIGLLRTEYFYLAHSEPPDEEEQYGFYREVVEGMGGRPVTVRLFDLGGDKLPASPPLAEANPMLGARGIRLLLEHLDLFTGQVRAVLRASCHGPVRVMFPLITSLTQFQEAMTVVRRVQEEMRAGGVAFDPAVPFGCMVETPAAATIADILAEEAEFFSIGSNDLIQYTLAADRTNPRVAGLYEPLHLALLRYLQMITRAARERNRPVSLCGEMASDPIYTIILLGLGITELSMNPGMIPAIKQIIRQMSWAEAHEVAEGVLRERRARDVQTYLEKMMSKRFPEVMSIYGREAPDRSPGAHD